MIRALFVVLLIVISLTAYAEEEHVVLQPIQFSELQGWSEDSQDKALGAFERSCGRIASKSPSQKVHGFFGCWNLW